MKSVSNEIALILNLRNAAIDHKKHCQTNCNVSVFQLRSAAIKIKETIPAYHTEDHEEAELIINEMPRI